MLLKSKWAGFFTYNIFLWFLVFSSERNPNCNCGNYDYIYAQVHPDFCFHSLPSTSAHSLFHFAGNDIHSIAHQVNFISMRFFFRYQVTSPEIFRLQYISKTISHHIHFNEFIRQYNQKWLGSPIAQWTPDTTASQEELQYKRYGWKKNFVREEMWNECEM